MKKLIVFTLAVLTAISVFGRIPTDSVKVYFRIGHRQFDPTLGDNRISTNAFNYKMCEADHNRDIDRLVACAYASPDGQDEVNQLLSQYSCEETDKPDIEYSAEELSQSDNRTYDNSRHILALKTNFLYYGVLMPNIELEWMINNHWSVAVEGDVAWWSAHARNFCYQVATFTAEGRYWIRPRAPWHGMYVGAFGGGGLYDLQQTKKGYYGEGFLAGLSVGYVWPIANNFSLEAGIGAGYMHIRNKDYLSLDGHHLYQRTRTIQYIGPLKAKFSLVWRFLLKNKPTKINPAL